MGNFDMMVMRQYDVSLRLAQNTPGWNSAAGALVQTCTKKGKCNFPYLLGRCWEEKLTVGAGSAVVQISGGINVPNRLIRDTCDVEDNRISWDAVKLGNAHDGSGYWQEKGCNCGKVVDRCQRI